MLVGEPLPTNLAPPQPLAAEQMISLTGLAGTVAHVQKRIRIVQYEKTIQTAFREVADGAAWRTKPSW